MGDWYQEKPSNSTDATAAPTSTDLPFQARRSPLVCRKAAVASSQPLASAIGYDLLKQGANAAETAVAVAAALAVTEPCSTGLGGDAFCLHFDAASKNVTCINGSGKSAAGLSMAAIRTLHGNEESTLDSLRKAFRDSPLAVTVPGAAACWEDTIAKYGSGKFTLAQLLEPAAALAEEGFPVAPVTAHHWTAGQPQIRKWYAKGGEVSSTTPPTPLLTDLQPGTILRNPDMARVLRELGAHGAQAGFYQGRTGQAIVAKVQEHGGCLTQDDLTHHTSIYPEPIGADFRGVKLWQAPPNGQGVAGLIALESWNALAEAGKLRETCFQFGSADWYHSLIEVMRLGFADAQAYVSDMEYATKTPEQLLDPDRIAQRVTRLYNPDQATIAGVPDPASCTVSFQVVDSMGNAISFVNSNYMGFGTGLVPDGCGFSLQNRGFGFRLEDSTPPHPNAVGPSKRPLHTILPGLLTHVDTGELFATFTNMGGMMQPQGHLQLTLQMLLLGLDPQTAIDRPRFCIADGTCGGVVSIEEGVEEDVVAELRRRGHEIEGPVVGHNRSVFGRAQIIKRDRKTGVLWAGSDGRADGCAMGF